MDPKGTKRIRIAVAVAVNGDWASYGSFAAQGMTDDQIDQLNRHDRRAAENQLMARKVRGPYRINMIEVSVYLPILEIQDVAVHENE